MSIVFMSGRGRLDIYNDHTLNVVTQHILGPFTVLQASQGVHIGYFWDG